MSTQQDVQERISSVKNIEKITRAMQMVAAARLRRAEQRIEALRPYADAIRKMTRQAAEAAENIPNVPILYEHDQENDIALLLVTGDRGLAGWCNSQIIRAGMTASREHERDGQSISYYASGRRGVSSLEFRGKEVAGGYIGFTDRPSYDDARKIAQDLMAAYVDEKVDRVEIFYNGYISPLTQVVRRETLLPLEQASILEDEDFDEDEDGGEGQGGDEERSEQPESDHRALVEYEPDPEEILKRLVPDYVEVSVYRALLESTASEHGARMTAMRQATDNAKEMIDDLTLEANRARQAEITQEIMEVGAGAEAPSEDGRRGDGKRNVGRLEEIQGVVIEAVFPDELPEINHAITLERPDTGETAEGISSGIQTGRLVCEVQQHLGDDRVLAVAMDSTDGLSRGMEVVDTGGPITVPVGDATLGRIFNLLGETIDEGDPVETDERWPIHRGAPDVEDLTPTDEMLETGLKVIDLLAPYAKGGKVGLFGGAGVGKTVLI